MRSTLIAAATAAVALNGCGDAKTAPRSAAGSTRKIPAAVQKIVDSPVPQAGRLQVRRSGNLVVDDDTHFCVLRSSDSLGKTSVRAGLQELNLQTRLEAALSRRGWGASIGYVPRVLDANSEAKCAKLRRPVYLQFLNTANRQRGPYRIALAAWQGDSHWVGQVERDRKRPDSNASESPPKFGDGPCCEPEQSMQQDSNDLADQFIRDVTEL